MKDKIYSPQPLILTEGYYADLSYDNYGMLVQQGAKNWKQGCPYQLQSTTLSGQYQIVQLSSMQIGYGKRKGAAMYTVSSAKDSLSIALIETCKCKSCFDRMKLREGDILFFDDSHPHNWITDGAVEHVVITIQKSALPAELSNFSKLIGHNILDTDARLITTLYGIKKWITDDAIKKDTKSYREAEAEILAVLTELLSEQTPVIPKLTVGEKIVLDIRDRLFGHMDGKISISSLAKEYKISEQTLQTSFKSLFGYTPKNFFRLLKLNLVHQELMENNPSQTSVMQIANKWGFQHMGHFSAFYTELFEENPSKTLKTLYWQEESLLESCVDRQEEID